MALTAETPLAPLAPVAPFTNTLVSLVGGLGSPPATLERLRPPPVHLAVAHDEEIAVVVVPATDHVFADQVAARIHGVRSGRTSLPAARAALGRAYPDANLLVSRATPLGARRLDIWLAYRDGRQAFPTECDAWWSAADVPRAIVQSSGELTPVNAAGAQLFGLGIPDGARSGKGPVLSDALIHELTDRSGALARHGEITSVTTLSDDAGTPMPVEYHAVRHGSGLGRHLLSVRSMKARDAAQVGRALDISGLAVACSPDSALMRGARRVDLAPGEALPDSLTGDPWAALVVSGVTRLHLVTETCQPSLTYGRSGSLFGTHLLPGVDWYTLALQSVTASSILVLDPRRTRAAAAVNPALSESIALAERRLLLDLAGRHAMQSSARFTRRLAHELLVLRDLQGGGSLIGVTEQILADAVGSIRESVARGLAELRRRRWVATTRYGVIVVDVDALARHAHPADA